MIMALGLADCRASRPVLRRGLGACTAPARLGPSGVCFRAHVGRSDDAFRAPKRT
jgi:hypothetical protein